MSDKIDERSWLNRQGEGGIAAVRLWGEHGTSYSDLALEISDCNRVITLEFGFDPNDETGESYANSLYKAKTLVRFAKRVVAELVERGPGQ